MTKSAVIRARVNQAVFDDVETLANRNRVKMSDVVREAVENHIAATLVETCPVCNSTEIRERFVFDRGLARDVRHTRCADCGTEID